MPDDRELPAWMKEAEANRAEHQRVRESLPKPEGETWHRGALIEALTQLGTKQGSFGGEHVEGDAFFARQSTEELRSLLEDHWFLLTMDRKPFDITPPTVPEVPEPELPPTSCRCNCGPSCGRGCGLPLLECIEAHYVRDCDHEFEGWQEFTDTDDEGNEYVTGGSTVCQKCGLTSLSHDMMVGP
jgi:hypothetical protein